MNGLIRSTTCLAILSLAACASLEDIASPPGVSLRNVEVQDIDFDSQVFLLSFDVTNPNPFPLPINKIDYEVSLNGERFAAGKTPFSMHIPAGSDGEFAITVDLDLLTTAPELLFTLRDAARHDLPYHLSGQLWFDIPGLKPARFESRGDIRLQAAVLQ